jgi:hypothetical protein
MDAQTLSHNVRLSVLGTSTTTTLGHALDICDRMGAHDLKTAVIWLTPPIAIKDGGPDVVAMTETEILPLIAKMRAATSRQTAA